MSTQDTPHKFYSDSPKTSITEDDLGWEKHVDRVISAIEINSSREGFTIGLAGSWGSGKSTFLNFLLERLKKDGRARVFPFNPWTYPKDDLVASFYWDLSKVLDIEFMHSKYSKAASVCKRLARVFTAISPTHESSIDLVKVALPSYALAFVPTILWNLLGLQTVWLVVGIVISLVALTVMTTIITATGEEMSTLAKETATLEQLKRELAKALSTTEQPIVVMVDDVDRLPPKQMCEVFQIIKNNCDLPGIVYVVAYDRDVVEQALTKEYGPLYRHFVDKIVQLDVGLPPVERHYLDKYVSSELEEIIGALPSDWKTHWLSDRWSNYFLIDLRWYYTTLREAKRILNGIRLSVWSVLGEKHPEVNIIDFLSIEFMRLKYPSIYAHIRDNKAIYVGTALPSEILGASEEELGEQQKSLDAAFESIVNHVERRRLREFVGDLFPRAKSLKSLRNVTFEASDADRVNLRICVEQVFDRYFLYGNYIGDLTNSTVEELVANFGRDNVIQNKIRDLVESDPSTGRLRVAIDLIRARFTVSKDFGGRINDFVRFVFDSSDFLKDDINTTLGTPVRHFLIYAVKDVLAPLDPRSRGNVLSDSGERSYGIFGPVLIAAALSEREATQEEREFVDSASLRDLKAIAVKKGKKWLNDQTSLTHPHFDVILFYLKIWLPREDYEYYIGKVMREAEMTKRFIARFYTRTELVKAGAYAGKISYRYNYDRLSQYVDVSQLYESSSLIGYSKDESPELIDALEEFRGGFVAWSEMVKNRTNNQSNL
jgi:predicted KAP-like P-loop ATPase